MEIRRIFIDEFDKYWNTKREFSKFEALLDLYQLAAEEDEDQMIHGQLYKVKRGQRPIVLSFLEKRWNWSRQNVRTFITKLETSGVIKLHKEAEHLKLTTLTICHYDSYKEPEPEPQKKYKRKPPDYTFIDSIIAMWQRMYLESRGLEYDVTTKGKDRLAVGKLINMNKEKNPDQNTEQATKSLELVFQVALNINPRKNKFLYDNMSLSTLVSQWNTIKAIHNGANQRNSSNQQDQQTRDAINQALDQNFG